MAIRTYTQKLCDWCGTSFLTRHGSRFCSQSCVNHGRKRPTLWERFQRRVDKRGASECWPWKGPYKRGGYGSMKWTDGRYHMAHRIAYAIAFAEMPSSDMHVCHRCDNPPCCNPAHLYMGTPQQNVRDRDERGRTSRGERHYAAKLSTSDVLAIRASSDSHSALSRQYGVAVAHIANIRRGNKWKGVEING